MTTELDAAEDVEAPWAPYVENSNMVRIPYTAIRTAMKGEPFWMSLTGHARDVVIKVLRQGIDSALEACNCPDRGDRYEQVARRIPTGQIIAMALDCSVSVDSLPTLLRRLSEHDDSERPEDEQGEALSLVDGILQVLGFAEDGTWKLRKDD
jgi:hypothetical protein